MKVEIYGKKKEEEKVLRLKLESSKYAVHLIVVDENGLRLSDGYILRITDEGILKLYPNINEECGLQFEKSKDVKSGHVKCEQM